MTKKDLAWVVICLPLLSLLASSCEIGESTQQFPVSSHQTFLLEPSNQTTTYCSSVPRKDDEPPFWPTTTTTTSFGVLAGSAGTPGTTTTF